MLTTHGQSRRGKRHPLYWTWKCMRQRCLNPHHRDYRLWGGRGITICARWDDFEAFAADMGPKPTPQHSLDRIDNDLLVDSYSPTNCRWATKQEQVRNRRPRRGV
jgi:hypothetical protein